MELIVASQQQLGRYAKALKEGLELASGARSTSTYYHSRDEQIAATRRKVIELYGVDKSIPLLLASLKDTNHYFRQEALSQELRSGAFAGAQAIVNPELWLDSGVQENMIIHIMDSLPITYALRLFISLKKERVNNARTRRVIASYVLGNLNDFTAMKYRNKMRQALKHVYGTGTYLSLIDQMGDYLSNRPVNYTDLYDRVFRYSELASEDVAKLMLFVERKGHREWYGESLKHVRAFYDAKYASTEDEFFTAARLLDIDVARGIVSHDNLHHPLFKGFYDGPKLKPSFTAKLLEKSKVISEDQKVRTKKLQERSGGTVRTDVDYDKVTTETLYKTEGAGAQRMQRAEDDRLDLPYSNIGIIVDISLSNRGGRDSADTPAAIISHLQNVLLASVEQASLAYTSECHTDLSAPLCTILEENKDVEAIFVLSDGYENFPYEGCFNDLVKHEGVQAIHCSPYVSAEMKAQARTLGDGVITMAVNKPSQIDTQMKARLLDFDPKQYFENQFSRFLPEEGVQMMLKM